MYTPTPVRLRPRARRPLAAVTLVMTLTAAALLGQAALAPAPACAQDMSQKLQAALSDAQTQYDMLQLPEAEKALEDALGEAERFGVKTPVVAKLHIMLGVVRFAVTRDESEAYTQFLKGLKVDRTAEISPDYQTPSLMTVFERAREAVPPPENNGPGPGPGPDVVGAPEIKHSPPPSARLGQALELVAEVPEDVPLYRVVLSYRRYGERDYKTVEMAPTGTTRFVGTIPGGEVRSSQLDYFMEVLSRTGQILAAAGAPAAPLNLVVFGDDEPLPGDGDDKGKRQFVFFQATAGTGFGLATGTPRFFPEVEINPGIAPAPFTSYLELGVMITRDLHLSGFYRLQIVEREDLFGGKLKWWFDNDGPLVLYTGLGGGYGRVRHTVDLAPAEDFVDTTAEGPAHIGFCFGMGYNLSPNFALVVDAYALGLFPDVSVHMDASLGFRVSL